MLEPITRCYDISHPGRYVINLSSLCNYPLTSPTAGLALRLVLPNPCLPPATHSLISRVLLSLNIWLPSLDPIRLSSDLSLHAQILRRIQGASIDLSADARCAMSRNLGLVMYGLLEPIDNPVSYVQTLGSKLCSPIFLKDTPSTSTLKELDRLLHPRVPPLVRAPPHIELLSLSRTEESAEEQEIRESLHLSVALPSGETTGKEISSSIPASAPAPLPLHPNPDTLFNVDEPKTSAPAPLQQSPLYPQASEPPDPRPAPVPSHGLNVSSPAQIPSTGRLYSNDTLCLPQADVSPPLMSGVVTATEGSHLGTTLKATNVVQEDDDDDEEMPSIDMASDSD
jgi:hypothetical protein